MMEYKNTGAVYEVRTYGSVRGMRQKPHPTRCLVFYYIPMLPQGALSGTRS